MENGPSANKPKNEVWRIKASMSLLFLKGILSRHRALISVLHHQKGDLARRLLPEYFENVKCTLQIKTPLSLLFLVFTRNRSHL